MIQWRRVRAEFQRRRRRRSLRPLHIACHPLRLQRLHLLNVYDSAPSIMSLAQRENEPLLRPEDIDSTAVYPIIHMIRAVRSLLLRSAKPANRLNALSGYHGTSHLPPPRMRMLNFAHTAPSTSLVREAHLLFLRLEFMLRSRHAVDLRGC